MNACKLTVVIVNYNVRHFLEQALRSVERALQGLDIEVFVVDNNSADGSVAMVRSRFPWVKLVASKENLGFARGNNLALRQARGEYVLLLNPDTVVEEDTFTKCLTFMDTHPDAGGLGVRMYNGAGEFLPESKRALPTPWVAFYKIFGLARLFPHSRRFGQYHLTYLDPNETHEVEVLSGAFMLMRKAVLDNIGLLDEAFFMYGEDVDLSYRILLAGYKNYYFPETKIIHYKGESTRKGSLNYVLVFYEAMRLFAKKHFADRWGGYLMMIQFAIFLRAGLSIIRRVAERVWLPTLEFGLFLGETLLAKTFWERRLTAGDESYYKPLFDFVAAPLYALTFIVFLALFGAYRRPYRLRDVFSAVFAGFLGIATLSYVVKPINFSRAIVLMATGGALATAFILRGLLNYRRSGSFFLDERSHRRVLVVGDVAEARRVIELLQEQIEYDGEVLGIAVCGDDEATDNPLVVGSASQLDEMARVLNAEEIIFCNRSMPTQDIIAYMSVLGARRIAFKIAPPDADYLVGPGAILAAANRPPQLWRLQQREYRFKKKLFDFVAGAGLLATFPLLFWMYRRPGQALRNLWRVVTGEYHLVGYIDGNAPDLPRLKPGLLNMAARAGRRKLNLTPHRRRLLDLHYARMYSPGLDLQIVLSGLALLGEKVG